jgi:predicted nucleic acid-binding protein
MAGAIFLADTSIYVLRNRSESVKRRFDALLAEGRLAACHMTALEWLDNAPDPAAYARMQNALHAHRWLDVSSAVMDRAVSVHKELGKRGQHRNFRLPDLIIAATAELNGATILHYDADYDRIAAITDQPSEWVVPRGSI